MKQAVTDAVYQILTGFLFTLGAILALLLAAWLGFNPFK